MKANSSEVTVFVRIRPTANFAQDLIHCLPDGQTVNVWQKKDPKRLQESRKRELSSCSFRLDGILQNVSQEEVYSRVCHRVVLGALEGYNGTVMCFGQTGAGKTYTMTGSTESYKQRGLIPRTLQEVFGEVEKRMEHSFSVYLSYLEIYNETLVDLLSSLHASPQLPARSLTVMEEPGRGVFVRGLSLHPVHSEEEALNLLFEGELNRIFGSHDLNQASSRSHTIFTVHIESRSRAMSEAKYFTSKLNLVDLAGSECLGKTGSEGQMLKEAKYINRSLSFLEQAVLALTDRHRDHVPFRQTKLTHVLKDSLGGNCNTVLVANIYGGAAQIEETISTLRFASRMKCVHTDPAVNEHIDPALQIKKLEKEVRMLKQELSIYNTVANRTSVPYEPITEAQMAEIRSEVQRYLAGSLEEISIKSICHARGVFAQFKLAVQALEQKNKAQLCQNCSLAEKDQNNFAATMVSKGSSGVGVAALSQNTSQLPHAPKVIPKKTRPGQIKGPGPWSPSSSKQNVVQTPEPESPDSEGRASQESQPRSTEALHATAPPPKADAFEEFKLGQGSEINRLFKENKAVLLERQILFRRLTEEVNTGKLEIRCTMATIQQYNNARRHQGQYLATEEESVDTLKVQLMEQKARYRQRYETLRDISAEVSYCQHLVDQCRVRRLAEFEKWFKTTFLDVMTDKTPAEEEDGDLHDDLAVGSSAESFYHARHRTLARRSSRSVSKTPKQKTL